MIHAVRGTYDVLPGDIEIWQAVESRIRNVFHSYGFSEIRTPILEKYDREGSPYYSTARLWDDGILDPARTREALALGLSAAYNAPIGDARFGVFRM